MTKFKGERNEVIGVFLQTLYRLTGYEDEYREFG